MHIFPLYSNIQPNIRNSIYLQKFHKYCGSGGFVTSVSLERLALSTGKPMLCYNVPFFELSVL